MSEQSRPRAWSREQWIVAGSLALVCALCWLWLLREGGLVPGAPAASMAAMGPMPGMAMPETAAVIGPAYVGGAFVMWFLMMTAMMTPSAAPMILIYARVVAKARSGGGAVLAPTAVFVAAYLGLWAAFSVLAALAQAALVRLGLVEAAAIRIGSGWIAGGLLIAAGAYQLTALKQACLDQCRSPVDLLMRWWGTGWVGTLRLGLIHGLFCLGCCWALMLLLFVFGVMNLAWIAVIAAIVLVEKLAPFGRMGARAAGLTAIGAGVATLGATALHALKP